MGALLAVSVSGAGKCEANHKFLDKLSQKYSGGTQQSKDKRAGVGTLYKVGSIGGKNPMLTEYFKKNSKLPMCRPCMLTFKTVIIKMRCVMTANKIPGTCTFQEADYVEQPEGAYTTRFEEVCRSLRLSPGNCRPSPTRGCCSQCQSVCR